MITYPLNNIDYTAEDAELYFATRESGVHDGDDFDINISGIDNSVIIGTGIAWIRNSKFSGKVVALKEPKTLTLSLPDAVYDRIDAIVIRFDANENQSDIVVKEGIASSSPVTPNVVKNESIYELHLYHILREAGSNVIRLSAVTDQRKNPDYCGIMIDPVTAVDETLSKRGFAADAASVGIKLNEVKQSAAPAGYGLGEASVKILTSSDDLNSIRESGWYRWGESVPSNAPTILYDAMYSYMRVDAASSGTFTQTVRSGYGTARGIEVKRSFTGDTTDGWEWVNPLMQVGVEYRTTERYLGKPVYAKAVDMGELPVDNDKIVATEVYFVEKAVSASIEIGGTANSSMAGDFNFITNCRGSVSPDNGHIYATVTTTSGIPSGATGVVTLKYTKTTD